MTIVENTQTTGSSEWPALLSPVGNVVRENEAWCTALRRLKLPKFGALMSQAVKQHECGNFRAGVQLAVEAMVYLLSGRIETVDVASGSRQMFPVPGVSFLRTEKGLRAFLKADVFTEQESAVSIYYVLGLCARLPRRTVAELLYVHSSRLGVWLMCRNWPDSRLRIALRLLNRLRFQLFSRVRSGEQYLVAMSRLLGDLLHEPGRHVLNIMREQRFYTQYHYARRLRYASVRASSGRQQSFLFPDRQAYLAYIHANPGSRVLLTIHMGDFVGALQHLASLAQEGRQVITIRRQGDEDEESPLHIDERLRETIVRHEGGCAAGSPDQKQKRNRLDAGKDAALRKQRQANSTLEIVRAMRAGSVTLSVLFDLQQDFGQTTDVSFFGQAARLVRGPAEMAIIGRAPIIPFVTFERGGVDVIEVESLIDTRLRAGENLADGVGRITQQLASLAETWIRRTPQQWKYLPFLFQYFHSSEDPAAQHL